VSTISRPTHGKGDRTSEYVGAARPFVRTGVIRNHGYLYCTSCGGSTVSMADFASIAGVTPRDVSNFLNRRPVRPDKAEAIRSHLAEVDEDGSLERYWRRKPTGTQEG
jgi:hypothetical protein